MREKTKLHFSAQILGMTMLMRSPGCGPTANEGDSSLEKLGNTPDPPSSLNNVNQHLQSAQSEMIQRKTKALVEKIGELGFKGEKIMSLGTNQSI